MSVPGKKIKFSAKGIQKDGNDISYKKSYDVLFEGNEDKVINKGMRYVNGYMKSYEQRVYLMYIINV